MRRERDHPRTPGEGTFQRARNVHELGFRLAVVCSLVLALAGANFASDAAMSFARVSDVCLEALFVSSRIGTSASCSTVCIWRTHQHCLKWKAVVNRRSLSQSLFSSLPRML